jgi:hypothetical protein
MDGGNRVCKMSSGGGFVLPISDCAKLPVPNADGAGYYHFTVDGPYWAQLIAAAPNLSAGEQITLIGNVFAGLRAGQAKASDAFALVHALAPTMRWDVLRSLTGRLSTLRQSLAPVDVAAYRAFLSREFAARFKTVGVTAKPDEAPADAYLREGLATLLVTEAHDADATAALAGPNWAELALDLRAEALRATLRSDPAYADTLVALFQATNEEAVRRDIVYAFAGAEQPAAVNKLLALAPGKMRSGEIRYLTQYMPDEPVARDALWAYMGAHHDAFAQRLTTRGLAGATTILKNACTPTALTQERDFATKYLGGALGAQRLLAHTADQIARCVAFRQAKSTDVGAALTSAP